ncbi:MAG: hypothetical protein U0V74_07810 [Chitinophagales bacterium]
MVRSVKLKQAVQYLAADDYQQWDLCEIMKRRFKPAVHLNTRQVLENYNTNPKELLQLVQRKLLTPVKCHNHRLWCVDDLDLLLEKREL